MINARHDGRIFAEKLKYAVNNGDFVTARRLIKGGVDINATYWYDGTLLHEAVSSQNVEMVKLLLSSGAQVNAANKDGRTALHMAARQGDREIMELLLSADANVNALTLDGKSSLHMAAWKGHTDIAVELVTSGANVNNIDNDGWTALHWAASSNLMSIAELLLVNQARINIPNKMLNTPLHESICQHHQTMIKLLLRHGADSNLTTKMGSSLQMLLRHNNCTVETVQTLVNSGYNVFKDKWLQRNENLAVTLTNKRNVVRWLRDKQQTLPPLTDICRGVIRTCMNNHSRDRTMLCHIQELPIPPLLKDYVAMTDILKT